MEARYESDMVELSGDGSYLMACGDRGMLFFEGEAAGKRPLADVEGVSDEPGLLVVTFSDATQLRCPFPSSSAEQLATAAQRLSQSLKSWR